MNKVKLANWNEVVSSCDHGKVYHLCQWGALLEEVHGHKLVYLQENNGVFPLVYISSLIFRNRLISLPFADYGGPCAQDEKTADKLISECQEMAQSLHADYIEIRCPDSGYFESLSKHGFVRRDDYWTFRSPLNREIEELWKHIGDKRRNMVRKAEKSGVQVIEATNKADLKAFYQLYGKTMKKLGSPPQPYKFFEIMWDLFYPQNLMMLLTSYEGKHIAGGLFFLHNGTIHYYYGCSLKEHLQLAPNDLILWHIMRWGNEQGFSYLDYGRSRVGEGTMLYKKLWGGEPVRMPYFYKFYKHELAQRQEIQYKRMSQLWSKYMPEFIANTIGPWVIKQVG